MVHGAVQPADATNLHMPISSFHSWGLAAMKSRISAMQLSSCGTSTATPRLRSRFFLAHETPVLANNHLRDAIELDGTPAHRAGISGTNPGDLVEASERINDLISAHMDVQAMLALPAPERQKRCHAQYRRRVRSAYSAVLRQKNGRLEAETSKQAPLPGAD
jgi:hypothetical protein